VRSASPRLQRGARSGGADAGSGLQNIGISAFYAALKEYEKVDELFVPPLLKNYMLGFFQWLIKEAEEKYPIPVNFPQSSRE
jgi:hypothetical protein